jgi:hypothetical protein
MLLAGEISINTEGQQSWTIDASASECDCADLAAALLCRALALFHRCRQFSRRRAPGILDAAGKTVATTRRVFTEADVQ